jgi:hypothetical protein
LAALVPPVVVTSTLAVPAELAGVTAVIEVGETTVTLVAAAPPIVTPVTPVKPVPVIVTDVPPVVGPELGEMPVTVGPGVPTKTSTVSVTKFPKPLLSK